MAAALARTKEPKAAQGVSEQCWELGISRASVLGQLHWDRANASASTGDTGSL